jgi:hypothetical protein
MLPRLFWITIRIGDFINIWRVISFQVPIKTTRIIPISFLLLLIRVGSIKLIYIIWLLKYSMFLLSIYLHLSWNWLISYTHLLLVLFTLIVTEIGSLLLLRLHSLFDYTQLRKKFKFTIWSGIVFVKFPTFINILVFWEASFLETRLLSLSLGVFCKLIHFSLELFIFILRSIIFSLTLLLYRT